MKNLQGFFLLMLSHFLSIEMAGGETYRRQYHEAKNLRGPASQILRMKLAVWICPLGVPVSWQHKMPEPSCRVEAPRRQDACAPRSAIF
jgi:hypothetical protein